MWLQSESEMDVVARRTESTRLRGQARKTLSLGGDGIDSAARVHWPACATQGAEARQQQAYGAARGDSVLAEFASVGSRVTSAGIVQRNGTLSRKANIGPPTSTLSHSVTQTEFSAATGARDASRRAHPL
jgi:hypothetical protein